MTKDEQLIIDELKKSNFIGLKSTNIRRDPLFEILQQANPYPGFKILRWDNGKLHEKEFCSQEHQNLMEALEYYELKETYQNSIGYCHSWGIEFYFPGLLKAIMEELASRCEKNKAFDLAWATARMMISILNLNEDKMLVLVFDGYSVCLCRHCRRTTPFQILIYLPIILYQRRNIKLKAQETSWPTSGQSPVN